MDDPHFERVSGHGVLHPDRTALRIGGLASSGSRAIDTESVERLHDDGIARLDAQRRRVLAHGVEKALGIETMRSHAVSSWEGRADRDAIVTLEARAWGTNTMLCIYRDIVI